VSCYQSRQETGRHQSQKWIKNDQGPRYSSKHVSQNDNKSNTFKTNFENNFNNNVYKYKKCNRKYGPKKCAAFLAKVVICVKN